MAVSVQGIWAFSRCATSIDELREKTDTLMSLVETQLSQLG